MKEKSVMVIMAADDANKLHVATELIREAYDNIGGITRWQIYSKDTDTRCIVLDTTFRVEQASTGEINIYMTENGVELSYPVVSIPTSSIEAAYLNWQDSSSV
jgi:hypothetical protein